MKEKTLFILNPFSGNGRGKILLPKLKTILKNYSNSTEVATTEYTNHATELVKGLQNSFERIIVVGGDGTLNEALNGLEEEFRAVLGIIPAGSGNDFAKTVGMLDNFDSNIRIILNNPKVKDIDFGEIQFNERDNSASISRRFINSAGIGFDALVSDMKNNSSSLKGLPQYILAIIQALKQFSYINIQSNFDNETDNGEKILIAVSNGRTYGGGIKVNPFAEIDDGYLDACLINPMPIFKVLRYLPKFVSGRHNNLKEIRILKFIQAEMKIISGAYIHVDGEVISSGAHKILFKIHPKKLKFIFNPHCKS